MGRQAVCSLWRYPLGYPSRALPGTVLCGVRTFLDGLATAAITQPSAQALGYAGLAARSTGKRCARQWPKLQLTVVGPTGPATHRMRSSVPVGTPKRSGQRLPAPRPQAGRFLFHGHGYVLAVIVAKAHRQRVIWRAPSGLSRAISCTLSRRGCQRAPARPRPPQRRGRCPHRAGPGLSFGITPPATAPSASARGNRGAFPFPGQGSVVAVTAAQAH